MLLCFLYLINSPFVSANVPGEHEVDIGVKNFGVCINLSSHQISMYARAFFSYMNVIEV